MGKPEFLPRMVVVFKNAITYYMIPIELKNQVKQLVDSCKDENLLQEVMTLLNGTANDWWLSMSNLEKERTAQALKELNEGKSLSNESVMHAAWQKIAK